MKSPTWPPAAPEVTYFVDLAGTWFAAEVVRVARWSPGLLVPPEVDIADIRLAFLERPAPPAGVTLPGWLVLLDREDEMRPAVVVSAALQAWQWSPYFRPAGPTPEEYARAGFQALCPPHPGCEPGHAARESLQEFLRDRPGPLGRLGGEGRDALNRLLRVHWATPQAFADDVLRERIADDGAGRVLSVIRAVQHASIAPEADAYAGLAVERESLLRRLEPVRYFTAVQDFEEALALAPQWLEHYERASLAHHRAVDAAIGAVLLEIAPAVTALRDLRMMNLGGRAVGSDAADRLDAAVASLVAPGHDRWPDGFVLGRIPAELEEARLAAAAVLAAIEVHRRRGLQLTSRTQR